MLKQFLKLFFWKPPLDIDTVLHLLDQKLRRLERDESTDYKTLVIHMSKMAVSRLLCIVSGFGMIIIGVGAFFDYRPSLAVPVAVTFAAVYAIERCAANKELKAICWILGIGT